MNQADAFDTLPHPPDTLDLGLLILGDGTPDRRLTAPHSQRAHRCYELSAAWIIDHQMRLSDPDCRSLGLQLHHGSVQGGVFPRIGHAWISFRHPDHDHRIAYDPVGGIHGPIDDWTRWANAHAARTYDHVTANRLFLQFGTYGPWHHRPFGLDDCSHGYSRLCPHDHPHGKEPT